MSMTILVKKTNRKEVLAELKKKSESKSSNSSLKKHYGKLKRNIDGLTYQKQVRKDEN